MTSPFTATFAHAILAKRGEIMSTRRTLRGQLHTMQWICETSGYLVEYPVDDPPGMVMCDGCGGYHRLSPGAMSEEDERVIAKIKETYLDERTIDWIDDGSEDS